MDEDKLYELLTKAIENGEITEEEAREQMRANECENRDCENRDEGVRG